MKKKLDVVFILDKSGSMSGSEDFTISSFNEYLARERKNNYETNITTILFNNKYQFLHKRVDVSKVDDLTRKDYVVSDCTALYDAIGNAINFIDRFDTDKVMFVIITDGYENSSREFDNSKIKKMIEKHSSYEFIYIGADIDSYACGSSIGIKKDNIANYKKDRKCSSKLFESVSKFEACMMDECGVAGNWKESLDEYINKNSTM